MPVVVITGAAGGIGAALARAFAEAGATLALADLRSAPLEALRASLPGPHTAHCVDVSDAAAVEALAEAVLDAHGRVDVLVNNAGVNVLGAFREQRPEDVRWLIDVNLFGVIHGCRAFLPALEASRGHIVNMSSLAGLAGFPLQTSYCASKFAVRGFSAALRMELAGAGVGVTCVLPGAVRTSLMRRARGREDALSERMAGLMERYAMPPERVASRVLRAVAANRAELILCPESHLLRVAYAVAPRLTRWSIGRAFARLRGGLS